MERLDRFMARANQKYYASRDPFADFTTSPEISQVFGELLGLWAADVWQGMASPLPVILAEAGPGRGTLMSDALRAISRVAPAFRLALRLHLIETSPRLRTVQASSLAGATWHDDLATLPPGPLILLANEFLDALPIRQFARRGGVWFERFVQRGRFVDVACDPPAEAGGDVVEASDMARAWASALAARLVSQRGAALFLDYGSGRGGATDTLQALRRGRPADPLSDPGTADLTAHVDFGALARIAQQAGARVFGPMPQGEFLAGLGLFQRTDQLARGQSLRRGLALRDAARRLAEPHQMGRLFKAFAVCDPSLASLPGFAS